MPFLCWCSAQRSIRPWPPENWSTRQAMCSWAAALSMTTGAIRGVYKTHRQHTRNGSMARGDQ